ncbi:unnamed protein product [Rotaria magnacalcarata]|uniref:Uncharacterized protein n=1 Tax=Rotaria magnacalcarata TaxID=392030 RepID=A0A819WC39_9BILA|nr:unnamed protein product [Rotaria magnacalcarata]
MLTVDDELDNDIAEPTKPDADGFRLLLLLLLLIQILNLLVKNDEYSRHRFVGRSTPSENDNESEAPTTINQDLDGCHVGYCVKSTEINTQEQV